MSMCRAHDVRTVLATMLLGAGLLAMEPGAQRRAPAGSEAGHLGRPGYKGMTLIWSDEFDGKTIDRDIWRFEQGDGCPAVCGWGNNELEYYQEENAKVKDGHLIIEARRESRGGKLFTSSRMITKGNVHFKFGRVDVRARLPEGQGIWPAIWMLGENMDAVGWPACGEIDIMEMIGGSGRENTVHGTAHWEGREGHASKGGSYVLGDGSYQRRFHVFSIKWTPEKITWLVDDDAYYEVSTTDPELSEFKNEFFFILNVAVGGNWPGNPDAATLFPQRMIVDYIRVFRED